MGFDNLMWHFDEGVTGLFGQWNTYSTVLVTLLIGLLSLMLYARSDPDTHPMLLIRQAQGAFVRQPGESAVYRSRSAPHSMPLHTGLDVRDPGVSKWARGRDGDLRDIWRRAVAGTPKDETPDKRPTGRGRVLAVYGTQTVEETSLDDMTRQINLIGQHLLDQGGNRVAIYLPNSVEFLASLFACSFYNMTAILLPFDQSDDALVSMLRRAAADTVITAPGCFPFATVAKSYPALRQLVWVVDDGNKHLDWNEVPEGMGSSINVSTWQDIVGDAPQAAGRELPSAVDQTPARDITVFWETTPKPGNAALPEEMVRFTSANLVAAVAAQLFAVPGVQGLSPADLFLVADSLSHTHTLVLTLAALYANASIALNTAAPGAIDLTAATLGIAPTVVVATPAALLQTHTEVLARIAAAPAPVSLLASALLRWQTRTLTEGGTLPSAASFISRLLDSWRPTIGTTTTATPGKLRLLYTAERAGAGTPALSSTVLSDLRVFTGARVIYALAAAKVAGAAAQTTFYDYRVVDSGAYAPFGPPLTCTEYLVRDKDAHKVTDDKTEGEIVIRGPSVAGNESSLGIIGVIRDDNTLAYA